MKILMISMFMTFYGGAKAWFSNEFLKITLDSIKCNHDKNLPINASETYVHFYDYSRNITEEFNIEDAAKSILSVKNLNKTNKFIIYVAGFKSLITGPKADKIRNAYKNQKDSYLIILDHHFDMSGSETAIISNYQRSVQQVQYIGKALAQMLIELRAGGILSKKIHCIGHSLGGQILGHTGEIFYNSTGEKIWRITALDPAGPCFSDNKIEEQVRSGVAEFVDIYHCNAGLFGTTSILGDADFFANIDGKYQPGCSSVGALGFIGGPIVAQCNHNFCIDIWTVTISNKDLYLAWRHNQSAIVDNSKKSLITYPDETIAGAWNPGNARGVYYFITDLEIQSTLRTESKADSISTEQTGTQF